MSAAAVRQVFARHFGIEPEVVAVGPGRVNLIGEHTDYSEGFVFPAAINRETWIAARRGADRTEMISAQVGAATPFDAHADTLTSTDDWGRYVSGMAWAMRQSGHPVANMQMAVYSTVPMGSGVSSSAALEMAIAVLHGYFTGTDLTAAARARIGQICENGYVGVQSGIMDQMASASGRADHAMFLDTRTLAIQYAPVPPDIALVLLDTQVPRALATSAYNERRAQCESAAAIMGVPVLRDADAQLLATAHPRLSDVEYRRARHVISENNRCIAFRDALSVGDFGTAGQLVRESHASLRDDFEVSGPELDIMADAANAHAGVWGARMMGGGFGGACIALIQRDAVEQVVPRILALYRDRAGREGASMICQASDGARIVA